MEGSPWFAFDICGRSLVLIVERLEKQSMTWGANSFPKVHYQISNFKSLGAMDCGPFFLKRGLWLTVLYSIGPFIIMMGDLRGEKLYESKSWCDVHGTKEKKFVT